ncbi:MAG: helix-turn-helix transcriptional regulator, partial [Cyanobacteria bacterium P01_F01_bin.116]
QNKKPHDPHPTLQDLRKKAQLTQREVAQALGVTTTTIASWESGRKDPHPKLRQIQTLMDLYNCSIHDLANAVKPQTPEQNINLKSIRENILEVSQQEFASMIGIAVSTVSRWERGQGEPAFTPGQFKLLITKLAEKNITLDDLPDDWSLNE